MRPCEACDTQTARRYCSDRCRCWARLHPGQKRATARVCAECGAGIDHLAAHATYCGRRCVEFASGRRLRSPVGARVCGYCNAVFDAWRKDQRGCCTDHGNLIARGYRAQVTSAGIEHCRFTPDRLAARLSMYAGCWVCGGPKEQVDHVKPLAAGGPHMLANLRPICGTCNKKKWSRWPFVAPARAA